MSDPSAERQAEVDVRALIEEMITAWADAPGPPPHFMKSSERAEAAEVGAEAVVWAWTNRVVRTAQAALVLHDAEFDVEASPLRRSLFEHAMAIHWLADKRGSAYQALVRARSRNMETIRNAQSAGWQLNEEQQRLLDEAIDIETDCDTMSEDTFVHARQRAEKYGLGPLHQGWLIETWTTHPSLMSALPYYQHHEESPDTDLYAFPKPMADRALMVVAIALLIALDGYERMVPDALGSRLNEWETRLRAISERMRHVDPADG